jgi:hypothetical protein
LNYIGVDSWKSDAFRVSSRRHVATAGSILRARPFYWPGQPVHSPPIARFTAIGSQRSGKIPDDVAYILCATYCLSSGGWVRSSADAADLVHTAVTRKEKVRIRLVPGLEFKAKAETIERASIARRLGATRIGKDQEYRRIASNAHEMFSQPT